MVKIKNENRIRVSLDLLLFTHSQTLAILFTCTLENLSNLTLCDYCGVWAEGQGRNHGWKVEGTKVWVPKPGPLRPAFGQRPGWVLGAGGDHPLRPTAVRIQGYHPRKIFENSDTKFCIPVTTWCEFSCFLKITAKKLGTNTLLTSFPRSLRLLRLWMRLLMIWQIL